jgi:hypothetical protein
MEFDGMRKQCFEEKDVPPHMSAMLEKKDVLYFDLGEGTVVSEQQNDGKNSKTVSDSADENDDDGDHDDADQRKQRIRHDKLGTGGLFVQSHSQLGAEVLMRFGSWVEILGDSEAIDEKRYLSLRRLLDLKQTKIANLKRSHASIATSVSTRVRHERCV